MKLIDRIAIMHGKKLHQIELLIGDLTDIPGEHAADVLVVSAFRNDYAPTRSSLIGALHDRGKKMGLGVCVMRLRIRHSVVGWNPREALAYGQELCRIRRDACTKVD